MLGSPQRRLDEIVRPGDGRGQYQKQDFREWVQDLGMLTRVAKRSEVIQQSTAGVAIGRRPPSMRLPESDFQPRRKLPPLFKRLPGVRLLLLLIEI
jgi:hypothetical protein